MNQYETAETGVTPDDSQEENRSPRASFDENRQEAATSAGGEDQIGASRPQAISGDAESGANDGASASAESTCCMSMVIAHLPAASTFSLGLMCGGLILFVVGFLLTRQELGYYVAQHQARGDITFDMIFPGLLYWVSGVSAGLLAYSLLHYAINVATSAMVARGDVWCQKSDCCVRATVAITLLFDSLLIVSTGLMSCTAFTLIYAQAMFAARLQRGVTQFDVNHYLATRLTHSSLIVEDTGVSDEAASATSFPMFYPSLALFIGLCLTEASLIMTATFLAINRAQLDGSPASRRRRRRRNRRKPVEEGVIECGKDQMRKFGENTQL